MFKRAKYVLPIILFVVASCHIYAQAPVGIYGGVPSQFRHDGNGYQVGEAEIVGQNTGSGTIVPVDLNFNFYALYSWIYTDATETATGSFLPADTYTITFKGPTGATIGSITTTYNPTYAPGGGPNGGAVEASPLNGSYARPGIQGVVTDNTSTPCNRALVQVRTSDFKGGNIYIIYPTTGDGYYYANDYFADGFTNQLGGGYDYYLTAYTPADGYGTTVGTNQFINSSGADQLTENLNVPGCSAQAATKLKRPNSLQ